MNMIHQETGSTTIELILNLIDLVMITVVFRDIWLSYTNRYKTEHPSWKVKNRSLVLFASLILTIENICRLTLGVGENFFTPFLVVLWSLNVFLNFSILKIHLSELKNVRTE